MANCDMRICSMLRLTQVYTSHICAIEWRVWSMCCCYVQCTCLVSNKLPYDLVCTCCRNMRFIFWHIFFSLSEFFQHIKWKWKCFRWNFFPRVILWNIMQNFVSQLLYWTNVWWMEQQQQRQQIKMSLNECDFDFDGNKPIFS